MGFFPKDFDFSESPSITEVSNNFSVDVGRSRGRGCAEGLGVSILALELMRWGLSASFVQKLYTTCQAWHKEHTDPESSNESIRHLKIVAKHDLKCCCLLWTRMRKNTNLPLFHVLCVGWFLQLFLRGT